MSGGFSRQVELHFGRGAAGYAEGALLQRAVAWRLVRDLQRLPLPAGPCADLGAGSGAVAQAMAVLAPHLLQREPLQVDLTAALLARNPVAPHQLLWDLNHGLPTQLEGAALLTSSFALQWLADPSGQVGQSRRRGTSSPPAVSTTRGSSPPGSRRCSASMRTPSRSAAQWGEAGMPSR